MKKLAAFGLAAALCLLCTCGEAIESEPIAKLTTEAEVTTLAGMPAYQTLHFDPDIIISTEAELEKKRLLTSEELCALAQELNALGNFQYEIEIDPEYWERTGHSAALPAIKVNDFESDIVASICFDKTYCFVKNIYFETISPQTKAAEKMLWFARLLFGNLPGGAFPSMIDTASPPYLYVNGEVMYRYYLMNYFDRTYHYGFSHCYNSIGQYKEFHSDAIPVTVSELPEHSYDNRYMQLRAKAKDITLQASSDYYEGFLCDEEGNSVVCTILNIHSKDTIGDIEKATVFIGFGSGSGFQASFYY